MSLTSEFDRELKKEHKRLVSQVVGFYSDLVKASPVDSGEFKGAWKLKTNSKWSWTIKNPQKYADILARGRRKVNGVWYGSEQWQDGLTPMIMRFERGFE